MGLTRRRKKGRREEEEIDLLTTAFNLPNRHTLERDDRRRALKSQQRVVVVRRTPDDNDDDTSESESDAAGESSSETESIEPDSEEEDTQYKRMPKTPSRKARQAAPSPTPIKPSRKSHRRLHSEPQAKCLKLVEAELARVPATEPRPTRKEIRREKKLRNKERKKDSHKSIRSQGSPPSRTNIPVSSKMDGTAPNFVRGPLSSSIPPVFQPPMAAAMPPPHATYYPPSMVYNQGPYVAHCRAPQIPGPTLSQEPYPAKLRHPAVPGPFTMSGTGAPHIPMSKSQELQRIQRDLDETTAALNVRPNEMALQARADALRNLLNSTLNLPMGRNPVPPNIVLSNNRVHGDQKFQRDDMSQQEKQQDITTKDTYHHTCNDCGVLRSRKFHEMHPLAPGKLKRESLCESCRETYHKRGVMGDRSEHICFGCGIFRSNGFNKRNFRRPGKPLMANFYGRCDHDMRDAGDSASSIVLPVYITLLD